MTRPVALLVLLVLLAGLIVVPQQPSAEAASAQAWGRVHGGFYSDVFQASGDLNALAAAQGKRVSIGGTFGSTNNDPGPAIPGQWSNVRENLDEVWKAQATPFYNLRVPGTASQIASGSQDVHINRWIDHMQLYLDLGGGRNLILAPLQEMNGDWVAYGCSPAAFRNAFRRIHDMIRARGIDETKVRFAWAPNGWTPPSCGSIHDYYPGDAYVDLIGISAYRWSNGGTVQQVMGVYVDDLAATYPDKPILIAQTGVWPSGTKSQWIRDMFTWAAGHPHVVAIIYFNYNHSHIAGETNWKVWSPPSLDAGWRDGMMNQTTTYQWPLTGWFQPGPLTLAGLNTCPQGADCDTIAVQQSSGLFRFFTYSTSGEVKTSFFYGDPADVPISGDWNCNGVETLGLYRRSTGQAFLRNFNTQGVANLSLYFGIPGDVPLAGDFNGDGCDTLAIYRPSIGKFYISNASPTHGSAFTADIEFYFGLPGDKPFVGDFNGDGRATVGLHRESTGFVYFRNSLTTGIADFSFFFGNPGDVIVAGDWNGNGMETVGAYRPSSGMFFIRNSHTTGPADSQVFLGPVSGLVSIRH